MFLRVSLDLGVIIPVIFVMAYFWTTNILYAPFLNDFDDNLASMLLEREDVHNVKIVKIR